MEFLKKNYEKVVLGVVLLGLTVAVCLLPVIISAKRAALDELITNTKPIVKPLPPVDMTLENTANQRAQSPFQLDFTTKHNLFNPVVWKKVPPDGHLLKESTGNEEGPEALQVTNIKPLYLILSFGEPSANGYFITIERQAAAMESKRHTQTFVSKENKSELLTLQDVQGPPDKPTALILQWNETGETISLSPDKPFKRVEGYEADLKYPVEANKAWTDRRVGARLTFANGYYNIVAITESNVVVSAESNKKKTTITFHPATEPR